MPIYDYQYLVQSNTALTTDVVGTNPINTGVTNPGFEKSGQFGLHIIIDTTFTSGTEGLNVWVVHSASDNISTSSEKVSGMFIPVAEMTKATHFFIPIGSRKLLQYLGVFFDVVSTSLASGYLTVYFGDREWVS